MSAQDEISQLDDYLAAIYANGPVPATKAEIEQVIQCTAYSEPWPQNRPSRGVQLCSPLFRPEPRPKKDTVDVFPRNLVQEFIAEYGEGSATVLCQGPNERDGQARRESEASAVGSSYAIMDSDVSTIDKGRHPEWYGETDPDDAFEKLEARFNTWVGTQDQDRLIALHDVDSNIGSDVSYPSDPDELGNAAQQNNLQELAQQAFVQCNNAPEAQESSSQHPDSPTTSKPKPVSAPKRALPVPPPTNLTLAQLKEPAAARKKLKNKKMTTKPTPPEPKPGTDPLSDAEPTAQTSTPKAKLTLYTMPKISEKMERIKELETAMHILAHGPQHLDSRRKGDVASVMDMVGSGELSAADMAQFLRPGGHVEEIADDDREHGGVVEEVTDTETIMDTDLDRTESAFVERPKRPYTPKKKITAQKNMKEDDLPDTPVKSMFRSAKTAKKSVGEKEPMMK